MGSLSVALIPVGSRHLNLGRPPRVNPEQLRHDAEQLLQTQQPAAALQRLDDLVRLEPNRGANWHAYGRALIAAERPTAAIAALERGCGLDPHAVNCRTLLGGLYLSESQLEAAIHWHGEALALAPQSLVLRLNHACIWPVLAASRQQIAFCRQRCFEAFEQLQHDPLVQLDANHNATNHIFGLAYHGVNDRAWLEAYARLVLQHLAPDFARTTRPNWEGQEGGCRKLRLGFVSAYFFDHSNSFAFDGLLQAIDRKRFEVVLIHLDGSRHDGVRRRLEAMADRVVQAPADLAFTQQLLLKQRCDLLYFTDVGMNPALPALLCGRYAPVQVTGWGFPRTSGFPTLDYYLSGDLVEPAEAQEHYSETLIRLSGLPCRFLSSNLVVDAEAAAMGRDYFLLPNSSPLVGCLQRFWKLHPDLDGVLERIAQAVPDALFIFVAPSSQALADAFFERLRRQAPTAAERVLLLAQVQRSHYALLAGCMDVLLDTLHFGSGISFYDSAWMGTPMICQEGPSLCSRIVAGAYRLMGVPEAPVEATPEAMADRAITLLRDPCQREALRQRLRAAAVAHLYDRLDVVHSFEAFAEEAIARARREGSG